MSVQPHMVSAAAAGLLAILATAGTILGGLPSYPIPTTDQTLAMGAEDQVIPASRALDPLVAAHGRHRERNPFNLKPELMEVEIAVPVPPPPPVESLEPPPLTDPELVR